MKVYVDYRFMGRVNYPKLIDEFAEIDFVDIIEDNHDVEIMVISNSTLNSINIDDYPNLKWIQLLMAGYDNVSIDIYKEKGILVSNSQDIFSISIAEDVFSKILYFNRNMKHYIESMKVKIWEPIKKEPEIYNSIVSILGTGSIGQEIAKRMKAFGAKKILGYRKNNFQAPYFDEVFTGEEGLNHVVKLADYLVIALPLNEETYHIINKERLSLMKETAILINVARGKVIDQESLLNALKQKRIRGAGLDVTTPEPLPKTDELWSLDNVYITPHNASSSPYMKDRLYEMTRDNLKLYLSNEKPKYLI